MACDGYANLLMEQCISAGIERGTLLFVHSSIKAVGPHIQAESLIEALRRTLGDEGTLLFPTFTARTEPWFDVEQTPSSMGVVSEIFRKMPKTIRSRHPRHPVAAQGPAAKRLLAYHELAPGPCGLDTPFYRHAQEGGHILLLGVDFDTLTLLHTAEALLDLPYLNTMIGRYLDANGAVREISMVQVPGGHRGGVRGFEKGLNDAGLITYGSIGNAKCMVMKAKQVLEFMVDTLRKDPYAALCAHEYCPDCETYKAAIRGKKLENLGASISLLLKEAPENMNMFQHMVGSFSKYPIKICIETDRHTIHERLFIPHPEQMKEYRSLPQGYTGLGYNPLDAAKEGIQPFYDILYAGPCRDVITDIFIEDGVVQIPGTREDALAYLPFLSLPERVPLGQGNAQLREIVSALRMRNFSGTYHLVIPSGNPYDETRKILKEFMALLP